VQPAGEERADRGLPAARDARDDQNHSAFYFSGR
jgi:hypothetical protein